MACTTEVCIQINVALHTFTLSDVVTVRAIRRTRAMKEPPTPKRRQQHLSIVRANAVHIPDAGTTHRPLPPESFCQTGSCM